MPQSHMIRVQLGDDGQIETTVEGIQGPACSEASAWLREMIAVEEDRPTAEFYEQPVRDAQTTTW